MHGKKAMSGMMIGLFILVLLIVTFTAFWGRTTLFAKENLDPLKTCEGRQGPEGRMGHCEKESSLCKPDETAMFKLLGCGSGDFKEKNYCCLPPPI